MKWVFIYLLPLILGITTCLVFPILFDTVLVLFLMMYGMAIVVVALSPYRLLTKPPNAWRWHGGLFEVLFPATRFPIIVLCAYAYALIVVVGEYYVRGWLAGIDNLSFPAIPVIAGTVLFGLIFFAGYVGYFRKALTF